MTWILIIVPILGVTMKLPMKSGVDCIQWAEQISRENMLEERPKEIRCEVKWL